MRLPAFQNGGHVIGGEFAVGGVDTSAHHGAHHVVEKAVRADLELQKLAAARHAAVVHGADGSLCLRTDRAHGAEIVRALKRRAAASITASSSFLG